MHGAPLMSHLHPLMGQQRREQQAVKELLTRGWQPLQRCLCLRQMKLEWEQQQQQQWRRRRWWLMRRLLVPQLLWKKRQQWVRGQQQQQQRMIGA